MENATERLDKIIFIGEGGGIDLAVFFQSGDLCDQLFVGDLGVVEVFPREDERFAVVRLQAEEAVDERCVTALLEQGDRQKFALGLGHFAGRGVQMQNVEPEIAPLVSDVCLALRDLVSMVRESVIDTAAMQIQVLAVVFHGNGRACEKAFNMP